MRNSAATLLIRISLPGQSSVYLGSGGARRPEGLKARPGVKPLVNPTDTESVESFSGSPDLACATLRGISDLALHSFLTRSLTFSSSPAELLSLLHSSLSEMYTHRKAFSDQENCTCNVVLSKMHLIPCRNTRPKYNIVLEQ